MTKFESSFAVTGWDCPEQVLGAEMEDDELEADEEDGADIVSEWLNSSEWIKRWVEKSGDVRRVVMSSSSSRASFISCKRSRISYTSSKH